VDNFSKRLYEATFFEVDEFAGLSFLFVEGGSGHEASQVPAFLNNFTNRNNVFHRTTVKGLKTA
jgi:hypothetical protein